MEKPNSQLPKVDPKELKKLEEGMAKKFTLTFTKREVIVLFNVINQIDIHLGDARILLPIAEKLNSVAAIATNIPQPNVVNTGKTN